MSPDSPLSRSRAWTRWLAFILLVVSSLVVKTPVWQLHPQIFTDTAGYVVPALSLLDGRGYGAQENAIRPPTYPVFLAAVLATVDRSKLSECRDARRAVCIDRASKSGGGALALSYVVLAQIALGLLTTALLFALGWHLTRNSMVAFLFGAGYALNLSTAFWEISLLTETWTIFFLTLSVYLSLSAHIGRLSVRLLLGVALGALALCHNIYSLYWIVPTAYLALACILARGRQTMPPAEGTGNWITTLRERTPVLKRAAVLVAPVALIPILALGGWSTHNYFTNGSFGLSNLSAFQMLQMVAPAMERAPEEYRDLADIFITYRDQVIAETGDHSGASGRAWRELMEARGLTFAETSRVLNQLVISLILADPGSYLRMVRESTMRFWQFALFHYDPIPEGPPQWVLWFTDPELQQTLNILFWLSPIVLVILWLAQRRAPSTSPRLPLYPILLLMATVCYTAVIVALFNYGINSRYHSHVLPLQYGVIILLTWCCWRLLRVSRGVVAPAPQPV